MQAHLSEVSFKLKLYLTLKSFPLLLPSHNCINNFQCSVFKVQLRQNKRALSVCFSSQIETPSAGLSIRSGDAESQETQ